MTSPGGALRKLLEDKLSNAREWTKGEDTGATVTRRQPTGK